jgi:hypothetical protein
MVSGGDFTLTLPSERPRRLDRLVRALRRHLWLFDDNVRTDHSRAGRGFYVGGPPVSWRFVLPVVAAGVLLALAIIALGLAPD